MECFTSVRRRLRWRMEKEEEESVNWIFLLFLSLFFVWNVLLNNTRLYIQRYITVVTGSLLWYILDGGNEGKNQFFVLFVWLFFFVFVCYELSGICRASCVYQDPENDPLSSFGIVQTVISVSFSRFRFDILPALPTHHLRCWNQSAHTHTFM